MTRESRAHEIAAGIRALRRHARDETAVTIQVASRDAHHLVQRERAQARGGFTAERLALLRRVDAFEANANRTGLARDDGLEGVGIGDAHDLGIELTTHQILTIRVRSATLREERRGECECREHRDCDEVWATKSHETLYARG